MMDQFYKLAQTKFAKFLFVGASSYIIVTCLTIFLHEILKLTESTAFLAGLVTVFVINFFALRQYVFLSSSSVGKSSVKFVVFSLFFRAFEYVLFVIMISIGVYYIVALTLSMATSTVLKYFMYKNVVYK